MAKKVKAYIISESLISQMHFEEGQKILTVGDHGGRLALFIEEPVLEDSSEPKKRLDPLKVRSFKAIRAGVEISDNAEYIGTARVRGAVFEETFHIYEIKEDI